jgi:hypothetical protein
VTAGPAALAYRQNPDTMGSVNPPIIVEAESFQEAYFAALSEVQGHKWECWNLVAHIGDPSRLDEGVNARVTKFALSEGLHRPLNVAYTIFPHRLAQGRSRAQLYERYKERLLPRYRQWGTYFGRLIAYPGGDGPVNQLESAITSVLSSEDTYRACCTFLIPRPGPETRRHRGAPCLNYLALQLEPAEQRVASLLAVYRTTTFASAPMATTGACATCSCSWHGSLTALPAGSRASHLTRMLPMESEPLGASLRSLSERTRRPPSRHQARGDLAVSADLPALFQRGVAEC